MELRSKSAERREYTLSRIPPGAPIFEGVHGQSAEPQVLSVDLS